MAAQLGGDHPWLAALHVIGCGTCSGSYNISNKSIAEGKLHNLCVCIISISVVQDHILSLCLLNIKYPHSTSNEQTQLHSPNI